MTARAAAPVLSDRALLIYALLVSLGAAVGQGFARFGYALLLTPMQASLGWSYAQAGLINSANALGYLIGSLVVGAAVMRWGAPTVVRWSLLAVSLSLVTTGLWIQIAPLFVSRIVGGVGASLMYVAGVAVVMAFDRSGRTDLPIGVYLGGPGIGIAVSGLLVPVMLGSLQWDWSTAWVALGILGFAAMIAVEIPLRAVTVPPIIQGPKLFVVDDYLCLWPAMLAYTLFGLGYSGYMTFVVAFLRSIAVAPALVQWFWVLLGICAAMSGFTWRPIINRMRVDRALGLIFATLVVGTLLPILRMPWSFVLSAVLFGGTFLAVINVMTLQIRAAIPPERWATVVGNATALFAVGQLVGPTLTGIIADLQGGLALGLMGSAATLALGGIVAVCGREQS